MASIYKFLLILLCFAFCPVLAQEGNLMRDLMIVEYWNNRLNERLPVTYNHLLQGGYFSMPSARMGADGEIGAGYAWVNPYIHYNLRVQFAKFLEVSGNYRIFKGVDDEILTPLGFGDLSDKGANIKISPFSPEDSGYELPGLAFGLEDFMGTKNFMARYVALTQVFLDYDTEITLGYGQKRIRGFFGGISWMPFRQTDSRFFKHFSIAAEYDATPYTSRIIEKHPKARFKKSPINFGVKWRLWDQIDLSLSYIRGHKLAFSVSSYYNFGYSQGFLPKIDDAMPYRAPVNNEPIGFMRPLDVLTQDLALPFSQQGLDLLQIWISYGDCGEKALRLSVLNNSYRSQEEVRGRLNQLLQGLIPADIAEVIVVIQGDTFPLHEYRFRMPYVRDYANGDICLAELNLLTPLREATCPDPCTASLLFAQRRELWNFEVFPKTHTFFGSSKGKFKYALGLNVGVNGFLYDIYYSTLFGYIFVSNLGELTGVDRLNPSQLVNVRSDLVRYYKQKGFTIDQAYLQKNWNLGKGWFGKLSLGVFEEAYGGVAAEFLYYPVNSQFAFGFEGALLRKRTYEGFGFTTRARKLDGFEPHLVKFYPKQYFVNLYYNWCDAQLSFNVKMGKFLANDCGARFELTRYFSSGLQLIIWYTRTNGRDRINGKTYHDKGVGFSMPLDIFYTHSERDRWGYGMSAWLRDVGVFSSTGHGLYDLINEQRE